MLLETASAKELVINSDDSTEVSSPPVSSFGSKIYFRRPPNWHQAFFIRMDRLESFCMYPDLGGPFKSLDEAEGAISRHLFERQQPAM